MDRLFSEWLCVGAVFQLTVDNCLAIHYNRFDTDGVKAACKGGRHRKKRRIGPGFRHNPGVFQDRLAALFDGNLSVLQNEVHFILQHA